MYSSDNRRHFVFFSNQRESVIDSFPDAKSGLHPLNWANLRGEGLDGIPVRVRLQHLVLTHSNTTTTYTKMVYLDTMEEWQRQAKLLFQARPATVRKSTTHRMLAGQQR